MTDQPRRNIVSRLPISFSAIVGGILVGLGAANVWPVLLVRLGVVPAAAAEVAFLAAYVWWFAGAAPGPWKGLRIDLGRGHPVRRRQWAWGLVAAIAFAVTVHAAMVVLFRIIPFPAGAFHAGYDLSSIPTLQLKWVACIVSALSAGVCEEMGFRGYMQRPIEKRHGPWIAILITSLVFMLAHLNKNWSLLAMTPIVFIAALMLGTLARAGGTLLFCILGHWLMDIGLFAFWWTQIAGVFSQHPISETGFEATFFVEAGVLGLAVVIFAVAVSRLAAMQPREPADSGAGIATAGST